MNNKQALKRLSDMEDWEVMQVAVNRNTIAFAAAAGVSVSMVQKWQREPASDESPFATGEPCALTRLKRDMTAAYLANGEEAMMVIVDSVRWHGASLRGHTPRQTVDPELHQKAVELRNCLNDIAYERRDWNKTLTIEVHNAE